MCGDTFRYTLYPMVIALLLDHSYAVELYVAWILLRLPKHLQIMTDGPGCAKGHMYTDSMSYIQALQSNNDSSVQ